MFNGAMTPQKRHRAEELEDDIVLCIEVEKTNQKDHVEVACTSAYDPENPRICRRVIRAVRNELIRMINEQKEYGADITEFEHILHRDESDAQKKKNNNATLYDKSNGRIYTQNGRPQVRCPAKGLRVIPRLDYADRYSNKTGKPLNKSEARYEELVFRSPFRKDIKEENKESEKKIDRESENESVVDPDVEDDMEEYVGEEMDRSVNGFVADQEEGEEFEDFVNQDHENDSGNYVEEGEEENMNEGVEQALSFLLSQSIVNHYAREQQDSVEDTAVADTTTPFEEVD